MARWRSPPQVLLAATGLTLAIFVVDLATPLGVATGVAYIAVVGLAGRLPDRRWGLGFAALCSALTLGGGLASPGTPEPWKAGANRLLGLSAIWMTAVLLVQRGRAHDRNALLASLVESSDEAVIGEDREARILSWNRGATSMYGHVAGDVLGRPASLLVPPDRRAELDGLREAVLEGRAIDHFETVRMRRDGSRIDVSLSMSPIRRSGGVVGTSTIARDITERRRFEARQVEHARALETANEELRRSNQELDDFAYVASHDLRAPLRGIHNYSTFLLEDFGERLDEEGRGRLATIQRLVEHLASLIDSLLRYSRMGRVELTLEKTDLNELLEEVLGSLRVELEDRGVQVRVRQPLATLTCDRARIGEVLRHLLTNAIQYNEKSERWVEIGMADPSTVFVRDNGIGIRADHQDLIFQIFKRLHPRDDWGGGAGAGMTIVKKIVERHGGRIWLESRPDEGSTFYFTVESKGDSDGRREV